MEQIIACPICNNQDLQKYLNVKDHFGTKEEFELLRCSRCQTLATNPQPDEKEIIKYYKSSSYISHGDSVNPVFDLAYRTIQLQNLKYKKKLIQKYTLGKSLLDYGCGAGSFLEYMQKQGWNTTGIEPDPTARNIAQNKGIKTLSLEDVNSQFDCITLFHVLEHVHQLQSTLSKLVEQLSANGVLILALPNYMSEDAQYYQSHWAGYDVPRHLYHFNQKSIFTLAKEFGLNIVSTHPMHFDSYYVSLLSEKYKSGKSNLFNAFKLGLRSNRLAKKNKEYSSIIYILSK